jgi:hypothetical protein
MAEPGGGGGVKLPGVGRVPKKWLVIVGVASLASIGYFAYRRKSAAAVPAADGSGQIDPATGDVAGSAQDQMDLAALQDGSAYGTGAAGGYYAGSGALGVSGVTPPVPGTGGFTTNGQWAQQAEADLGGIGVDPVALAAALGHYLTGSPLTTAEQTLVDQAIAEEGYPPVAGATGYPPAMHASPTGPGGTGPGPGTGGGGGTTAKAGPVSNLQTHSKTATSVTVGWNPVHGATGGYAWALTGAGVSKHGNTRSTSVTVGGLKKGTTYNFAVQGLPGGPGDNIHVTL